MARTRGVSLTHRTSFVTTTTDPSNNPNNLPPPSTIAAQIVNHHTQVTAQREPEKKALFGQLLQEFLRDPAAEEPDLETNAQLIAVVTEAGLDALLAEQKNPFVASLGGSSSSKRSDVLLSQAADSLEVIRLTVARNPELLVHDAGLDAEGNPRPRLLVWLLAKLVMLLGVQGLEKLEEKVRELLEECVYVLFKRRDLWLSGIALLKLCLACAEGVVKSFEILPPGSQAVSTSFKTALPPSDAIAGYWPESKQLVALPQGCQASISSFPQALIVAFNFLLVTRRRLGDGQKVGLSTAIILQARASAFNAASQLWHIFKQTRDGIWSTSSETKSAVFLVETTADLVEMWFSSSSTSALSFSSTTTITTIPADFQEHMAICLVRIKVSLRLQDHSLSQLAKVRLLPVLWSCVQNEATFLSLEENLQLAISLWAHSEPELPTWPESVISIRKSLSHSTDFLASCVEYSTPELQDEIEMIRDEFSDEEERPVKRQKTGADHWLDKSLSIHQRYVAFISWTLYDSVMDNLSEIPDNASDHYARLQESDLCHVLSNQGLGMFSCAAANCLQPLKDTDPAEQILDRTYTPGEPWGQVPGFTCTICDLPYREQKRDPSATQTYWDQSQESLADMDAVMQIMERIIEHPEFQKSRKSRVLAAMALRRMFNHTRDPDRFDLTKSPLGQWCLRSLHSSVRELRIATSRTLPVFLRDDIPEEIRVKNRVNALDFCRTLSERNNLAEQETLILVWGEIARVCGDDELNLVLLQLIDYLGHTNPVICGIAYNELLYLSEAYGKTPGELLRPFWRNIAITVVRDLQTRPQKVQQLAEILGHGVNQLLILTQTETLPYLILMRRTEVLERIASASNPPATVGDMCMRSPRNLAAILSLLLRQPAQDIEKTAMELLCEAAPAFKNSDLSTLIRIEPSLTTYELLKAAADEDESKKMQVHRAILHLAMLATRKSDGSVSSSKKNSVLQSFFDKNILGIMAHFSDVIGNRDPYPLSERRRCLGAIEELIVLAKSQVTIALPQILACLHSALKDKALCDQTFSVWAALLKVVVSEEELESLIDQIFSVIAQNWEYFSQATQMKAHDAVADLIKSHRELLRDRIQSIPSLPESSLLSKFRSEIKRLKDSIEVNTQFEAFAQRCRDENAVIVAQALRELVPFLEDNQRVLHEAAVSSKLGSVVPDLLRAILDACVRFAEDHKEIVCLGAECLGLVGCLDPNRVETVREKRDILMLSNFDKAREVIDFSAFLLEQILVKVFHSTTNAKAQGFLAYVMQELLRFCKFNDPAVSKPRTSQAPLDYQRQRWLEIPESVRSSLRPFLTSKYKIQSNTSAAPVLQTYPIFSLDMTHGVWLRTFVFDLLQKGKGENARMIFPELARIIRGHDLSIASFMLPFACLNVVVGGTEKETEEVAIELLTVLQYESQGDHLADENLKQCSENVFQVLDYLSKWLQEKRKALNEARTAASRSGRMTELDELKEVAQISSVERVLSCIPAQVISSRAVECGSYARALFHWEQYIRQEREKATRTKAKFEQDDLYLHLQSIYAQIDEPDSIEGISAHLHVLDPDQQVLEHRKAGRWTAAQSWYELSLAEKPDDPELQVHLLTCLKESGQYDSLLNCVEGIRQNSTTANIRVLPFATEAAWVTGKWQKLEQLLSLVSSDTAQTSQEFSVGLGRAFLALRDSDQDSFTTIINSLRDTVAVGLSPSTTASLQACHEQMLKLHVLYEVEAISGLSSRFQAPRETLLGTLDRRLDVLGACTSDKQYLLGIRRACMQLSKLSFTKIDVASAWLTSARLARKANFTSTAFNAVLHAARLGDDASKIEHSRLLWKDGQHRKAIQTLEGTIAANAFESRDTSSVLDSAASLARDMDKDQAQNKLTARAHLLLAKWLDEAGQTKSDVLIKKYSLGITTYSRSDKGHYYLGKHYNKILESEKALPSNKQSKSYLAGELVKLVIENYTRSMAFGAKYYYHTVPKVLTLWLDFGTEVHNASVKHSAESELQAQRSRVLDMINKHMRKYIEERTPVYTWYTAFPQIITRIGQPNPKVYDILAQLIVKITAKYPQQALWSLLAVAKSTASERAHRGQVLLNKVRDVGRKGDKNGAASLNIKTLVTHGQRLTDALLHACEVTVDSRSTHASLSKDLQFNHKLAPCQLVVPIEATMTATLPTETVEPKYMRSHKPFSTDAVTISAFLDDVLVLSSLQRPRKLTVRGSDGRLYGLLCKPKDDLRKDQRLMEFNAMINRALHKDVESSKRKLYIKTYGVTPLNEECGTIEWVEGLKAMRDIILRLYKQKNVAIDYGQLRNQLNEASSDPSKTHIFTDVILKKYYPVLYEWFIETFPEPEAWFAARLRYTRSCAVMSIVGHVLGLGDRHGENVSLQEGNGGIFHVDFNCLFDKGLAFEKPELVPFRLTHNMVDAMGPHGCEGPYRTAAELTLSLLRSYTPQLMTILETFLHDPTTDFIGRKKRPVPGVPDTPQEVLDSVRSKLAGLLRGESVPLSVEGYVEHLIREARSESNLAAMYIGWCAFF